MHNYLQQSYDPIVVEHFLTPKNTGVIKKISTNNDLVYESLLGSESDGAAIQLQIQVDKDQSIIDAKFKAYGGVATIACASWLTEQIIGKNVCYALQVEPADIAETLKLPNINFFSAILVYDALQAALNDFIKG